MMARIVIALGLAAILAGCYESPQTTTFEPGVYKGKSDPLMEADVEARAATLRERFMLVQAAE